MFELRDQFNLSNKCHVKFPVPSEKLIDAEASVREFLPADSMLLTRIQQSRYWQRELLHLLFDFVYK